MPAQAPSAGNKNPRKALPRRTRGRPTLEDAAAIDAVLLSVALDEFREHGYGGASVARIARAARMSKATFYARYASKADLFRALMVQQVERIAPATSLATKSGPASLEEGLCAYANRILKLSLEADMLAINRLLYSESHRFPEVGAAATERTARGIQRIADFIRERARIDGIPCKDPDIIAEMFIYMVRGWYFNQMLTDRRVSPARRGKWVRRAVRSLVASRRDW